MSRGRPQKYGTQWHPFRAGELWPIDPATTDAERAARGVRPLAELRALRPGEPSSLQRP